MATSMSGACEVSLYADLKPGLSVIQIMLRLKEYLRKCSSLRLEILNHSISLIDTTNENVNSFSTVSDLIDGKTSCRRLTKPPKSSDKSVKFLIPIHLCLSSSIDESLKLINEDELCLRFRYSALGCRCAKNDESLCSDTNKLYPNNDLQLCEEIVNDCGQQYSAGSSPCAYNCGDRLFSNKKETTVNISCKNSGSEICQTDYNYIAPYMTSQNTPSAHLSAATEIVNHEQDTNESQENLQNDYHENFEKAESQIHRKCLNLLSSEELMDSITKSPVTCLCSFCEAALLTCRFTEVFSQPSAESMETSESWWCHGSGCGHGSEPSNNNFNSHSSYSDRQFSCDICNQSQVTECNHIHGCKSSSDQISSCVESCQSKKLSEHERFSNFPNSEHHSEQGSTKSVIRTVCLVGDNSLMMDKRILREDSWLSVNDSDKIICRRCRQPVGRKVSSEGKGASSFTSSLGAIQGNGLFNKLDWIRLDLWSTKLLELSTKTSTRITNSYSRDDLATDVCLHLVNELIRCKEEQEQYRFIIERRTGSGGIEPVVALWLMDTNALVYHSVATDSSTLSHHVKGSRVVKLLYRDCLRPKNKSFGRLWYRDMTVQNIELPGDHCTSLLCSLISSTNQLPLSLRRADDFYVGCLEKGEHTH